MNIQVPISKTEYAFNEVLSGEEDNCLDWEIWRETLRQADKTQRQTKRIVKPLNFEAKLPEPWLELTSEKKRDFRLRCLGTLEPPKAVRLCEGPLTASGARGGIHFASEVHLVVIWTATDTEIIQTFAEVIERLRRTDPVAISGQKSGKNFRKTILGRHQNSVGHLVDLAIWRLRSAGVKPRHIGDILKDLFNEADPVYKRTINRVENNLSSVCRRVQRMINDYDKNVTWAM